MQALGSYRSGKMLFLGLGTGLGSSMIVDGALAPMELGHLPYRKDKTFEDFVGAAGLKRCGKKKWAAHVHDVVDCLVAALEPDYVVLGGGNADKLSALPKKARLGKNGDAFLGGFRLWPPIWMRLQPRRMGYAKGGVDAPCAADREKTDLRRVSADVRTPYSGAAGQFAIYRDH